MRELLWKIVRVIFLPACSWQCLLHVAGDAVSSAVIDELRREIEQLKTTTVPKRKFDELHSEYTALKDSVAQLKTSFNKKLLDLMTEIDEEKKIRLNMQVEIDRVKKLAMS